MAEPNNPSENNPQKNLEENLKKTDGLFVSLQKKAAALTVTINKFATDSSEKLKEGFNKTTEETNKKIGALSKSFEKVKLDDLNEQFKNLGSQFKDIGDKSLSLFVKSADEAGKKLGEFYTKLKASETVGKQVEALEESFKGLGENTGKTFNSVTQYITNFGKSFKENVTEEVGGNQLKSAVTELNEQAVKPLNEGLEETANQVENVAKKGNNISDVFGRTTESVRGFFQNIQKSIGEGFNKNTEEATKNVEALNKGLENTEQAAKKLNAVEKTLEGIGDKFAALKVSGLDAIQVFGTLSDIFTGFTIANITIKGLTDSVVKLTGVADRIPMLFELMTSQGFSLAPIAQFAELQDVILGSEEAAKSFTVNAVSAYTQFEAALTQVNTILKGTTEQLKENGKQIQELVNNDLQNVVSSIQALNGQYQILSGGFTDAADSQNVLTASLKLATVGYSDADATAGLLVKTMRAYGFEAGRASQTAAELQRIVELGITTVPELTTSFGQTATIAKQAGVAIDQLGAAVAVLTASGQSTPTALTGIEALLRNIINKTPQAEKALAELSKEADVKLRLDVQAIRERGLVAVLQDISKAAKGNGEILSNIFPDSLAFGTALGLMADNGERFATALKDMGTASTEDFNKTFENVAQDRQKRFEAVINRFQELLIEMGRILAPVFESALSTIEGIAKAFDELPDPVKSAIGQFIVLKLTIGQVVGAAGSLLATLVQVTGQLIALRASQLIFAEGIAMMSGKTSVFAATIKDLIAEQKGLAAITQQLIGLDQSHLLVRKENLKLAANTTVEDQIKNLGEAYEKLKAARGTEKEERQLKVFKREAGDSALELTRAVPKSGDKELAEKSVKQYNEIIEKVNETYGQKTLEKINLYVERKKVEVETNNEVVESTIKETVAKETSNKVNAVNAATSKTVASAKTLEVNATNQNVAATQAENITNKQSSIFAGLRAKWAQITSTAKTQEATATSANVVATETETVTTTKNNVIQSIRNLLSNKNTKDKIEETAVEKGYTIVLESQNAVLAQNAGFNKLRDLVSAGVSKGVSSLAKGFEIVNKNALSFVGGGLKLLLGGLKQLATIIGVGSSIALGFASLGIALLAFQKFVEVNVASIKENEKALDELVAANRNASKSFAELSNSIDLEKIDRAKEGIKDYGEIVKQSIRQNSNPFIPIQDSEVAIDQVGKLVNNLDAALNLQQKLGKAFSDKDGFAAIGSGFEFAGEQATDFFGLISQGIGGIKVGFDSIMQRGRSDELLNNFLPKLDAVKDAILTDALPAISALDQGFAVNEELRGKLEQGYSKSEFPELLKKETEAQKKLGDQINGTLAIAQKEYEEAQKRKAPQAELDAIAARVTQLQNLSDSYAQAAEKAERLQAVQEALNRNLKLNQTGQADFAKGLAEQLDSQQQALLGGTNNVAAQENGVKSIFQRIQDNELENLEELNTGLNNYVEGVRGYFAETEDLEGSITRITQLRDATVTRLVDGKEITQSVLSPQQRKSLTVEVESLQEELAKIQQFGLDQQAAQEKIALTSRKQSQEEYQADIYQIEIQGLENQESLLEQQIEDRKKFGLSTVSLERELGALRNQIDQRVADRSIEIEQQKEKRIMTIWENALTAYKLSQEKRVNLIDQEIESLERRNRLADSRGLVGRAEEELIINRLQNEEKVTRDISERARIQAQITEQQRDNLEEIQTTEQQSLSIQNQINISTARRQEIQAKIAREEIKLEKFKLDVALTKARLERRPAEEIKTIELQIQAIQQQTGILDENVRLAQENTQQQVELNQNATQELNIRQQIARENADVEVSLSRQNEIIAQLEEQTRDIDLQFQAISISLQNQLLGQEAVEKSLEQQNKILDARKSILDAQRSYIETEFAIASDLATNERDRGRLAEDLAQRKLRVLRQTQEIERQSLELQLKQNEAATVRLKLENDRQKIQNQADIAKAQAELEKVKANPQSTEQDIKAAELQVQASIEQGVALVFNGELLKQQASFEQQFGDVQRYQLGLQQQSQREQAQLEAVNAIQSPSRRRRERRNLREQFGLQPGNFDEFSPSLPSAPQLSTGRDLPTVEEVRQQFLSENGFAQPKNRYEEQVQQIRQLVNEKRAEKNISEIRNSSIGEDKLTVIREQLERQISSPDNQYSKLIISLDSLNNTISSVGEVLGDLNIPSLSTIRNSKSGTNSENKSDSNQNIDARGIQMRNEITINIEGVDNNTQQQVKEDTRNSVLDGLYEVLRRVEQLGS